MPMRVSQLSFTADENYLILSAESGGGLAVYEVQSLLSGSTNSAFELSTNGETLRAMIPNPTSEKAELCAIVTNNGNLHMANLKERQISNPLKNQVSCVSWSSKGKQLCAGLGDGTIFQMTPEGEGKGEIPAPPNVGDVHGKLIKSRWMECHVKLTAFSIVPHLARESSLFVHSHFKQPIATDIYLSHYYAPTAILLQLPETY
jgi:nucleoporin NUP159